MQVVITSRNGATEVWTDDPAAMQAYAHQAREVAQVVSPAFDLMGMILAIFFWYVVLELVVVIATMVFMKDHKPRSIAGTVYYGISRVSRASFHYWDSAKVLFKEQVIQRITQRNARSKTMRFKKNPEFDEVDAWQAKKNFTLEHNGCKVDVKAGDWVGQDGFGNLKVYSDDVFRKAYTPSDGSSLPASPTGLALPSGE